MMILGPGSNGGKLYINVNVNGADFIQSAISSQKGWSILNINCNNGVDCSNNNINW